MEKSLIEGHLEKIIKSKNFLKSQINIDLLKYLTHATLDNKPLKEYTISSELFNKDNDGAVRVYIHNLRKKLNEYYQTEGKDDKIIFSIPKGQYQLQFLEAEEKDLGLTKSKTNSKNIVIGVLFFVFLIFVILLFLFINRENNLERTAVWKPFFENTENDLIVLGDHLFFNDTVFTGNVGVVRDFNINSIEDFKKFADSTNDKSDNLTPLNYTYLTVQASRLLMGILPYFDETKKPELKLASELVVNDLRNKNIIFSGSNNSLSTLKSFLTPKYFDFGKGNEIKYYDSKTDSVYSFLNSKRGGLLKEYAIVIKVSTAYDRHLLAFTSINDAGNIATINYFTNPDSLQHFQQQLNLSAKDSFKALFEVTSLNRTDMSLKLKLAEKIK